MADMKTAANAEAGALIIGCKLPHGYWMELIPESNEGWKPPPAGQRVKLNGANSTPSDSSVLGGTLIRTNPRVLGYGRTIVKREFWDKWRVRPEAKALIDKGFVFAEKTNASFRAHAKENLGEMTGLEGLTPEGIDPRIKRANEAEGLPPVEGDKEHLKRLQEELEPAEEEA